MNKTTKITINVVLISILFYIFMYPSPLYFTALSAHKSSERSIHYGPSEVKYIEKFSGGKYILGQYDQWVSCNTVDRTLLIFWSFGDQVTGFQNDTSKPVDFSGKLSDKKSLVYGIINDKRIKRIELVMSDESIISQDEFHDQLFLITYTKGNISFNFTLKAYDQHNNLLYQYSQ